MTLPNESEKKNPAPTSEEAIEEIAAEQLTSEFSRQLYKALIEAFDKLGGDPEDAIKNSKGKTLKEWVSIQKSQVAASGLVSNLIPGAHLAAMVADMGFLLHKMSYTCWGIGAILDCKILGKADFNQILQVWTNTQVKALEYAAISNACYKFTEEVIESSELVKEINSGQKTEQLQLEKLENSYKLMICNEVYNLYGGGKKIAEELKNLNANKGELTEREKGKIIAKNVVLAKSLTTAVSRRIASRIATKAGAKMGSKLAISLVGKMGARLATRAIAGFVPIFGGVVGGGLNYFFIEGIAKSAEEYYKNALRI